MNDREIRLIGSFRDDITPRLNRLNRQLLGTIRQFQRLQGRIAPVTAEMARFNIALGNTSRRLDGQRSSIERNISALREYRTEVGRAVSAQSRLGRGRIGLPRPTGGGGGGGGDGGGGGGRSSMAGGAFGMTLGSTLSNLMTNAIVSGFQMGTNIMMMPFKYGADAIGERIQDEMSDVKAAGGLFAISKRAKGGPFVTSFAEAESYTKEQNRYLAQLAGSLPGDTQEYINIAKQISDGTFQIIANDKANAIRLAQQLAVERGAAPTEVQRLQGGGRGAALGAGKELVGEMTKLTVLAGMGGAQGAFGLPQLVERMYSQQQVNIGMFQRYAAIFRDPMIKGALERNMAKINATQKDTTKRYEALRNTLQEVVTPELVRRYQRTTSGVLEALRTTFLNPEVGLLGLGRPLSILSKSFDSFGQVLKDSSGKIQTEAMSIFDYFRDIFANLMIVLQPIFDSITSFYEPFQDLGLRLDKVREATMQFQLSFERYRLAFLEVAKGMSGDAKQIFTSSVPLRASLQAVNNALLALGAYGRADFDKIAKDIADPAKKVKEFGKTISMMLDKFFGSKAAKEVGKQIGFVVGIVVAQVGKMMQAVAGIVSGNALADGFAQGFRDAGGPQGFAEIIRSVFTLFGKLLLEVFKAAPLETTLLASLTLFGPALAAAVSTALMEAIGVWVAGALGSAGLGAAGAGAAGAGAGSVGAGAAGTGLAATVASLLASPVVIAAAAAIAVAGAAVVAKQTEKQRQEVTRPWAEQAQKMADVRWWEVEGKTDEEVVANIWTSIGGELLWVANDFVEGFGNLFSGLADFCVGLFTDPKLVKEGINKMLMGLWQLFTMCGHLIIAVIKMIPGLVVGLVVAIKNLFIGIGLAIQEAWDKRPQWMGGSGGGGGHTEGEKATLGGRPVVWRNGQWAPAFAGSGLSTAMSFARAASLESRNMPSGAHPVVANSSELIIPTRARGQGDVGAIVSPLMSIQSSTSTVAAYLDQMRASAPSSSLYENAFLKTAQTAGLVDTAGRATSSRGNSIVTGPISISVDGYNRDPQELTEIIASELLNAMYSKSRSEVLTS